MRIKNLFCALVGAILLSVSAGVASAQVSTATGTITIKNADGTAVPAEGAQVTIYRTDIKGEYKVKAGKNGRYVYAGLPFVGTYTVVVSAPNARPTFLTGVRFNSDKPLDFTLDPGDGSTLTLEQINTAGAATGAQPAGGGAQPANSAASKKAAEEAAKVAAENEAKNKKIMEGNAQMEQFMKAGNEAFNAKKWDEAIAAYDQGIQVDPEQAVFYRNKAIALQQRGVDKYNTAVKAKDNAGRESAKADFKNATESSEKAFTLYRDVISKRSAGAQAAAGAAPAGGQAAGAPDLGYLQTRAESYRVALQTGTQIDAAGAAKAIEEYVAAETDPAKKAKAQASLGDALFQSGNIDGAVAAYQQILTASPDNLDAMYGLGLALAADPNADAAKMTQAREMLQKFTAKAPDTHPKKAEANEAIAALNEALKASSKPEAKPARRRG